MKSFLILLYISVTQTYFVLVTQFPSTDFVTGSKSVFVRG